jgi:predicted DCC family thiol-disulfide oxidoreductase YuxK
MHLVLYDDQCPLCVFQMKMLTWLDWLHVSRLVPLSSPEAQAAAPGIEPDALRAAIHVATATGKVHRGARCIRFLAIRMPLLIPLAFLLWVPGVIWIAEKVYDIIARNRIGLSRVFGCKEACSILPARKREGDHLK